MADYYDYLADAKETFEGKNVRLVISDYGTIVSNTPKVSAAIYINSLYKSSCELDKDMWMTGNITIDNKQYTLSIYTLSENFYDNNSAQAVASLYLKRWDAKNMSYEDVGDEHEIKNVVFIDRTKNKNTSIIPYTNSNGETTGVTNQINIPVTKLSYVGNVNGWSFYKSDKNDEYEWRKDGVVESYSTLQTAIESYVVSNKNTTALDLESVRKNLKVSVEFKTDLTEYERQNDVRKKFKEIIDSGCEYQYLIYQLASLAITEMNKSTRRKISNFFKKGAKVHATA